MSVHINFFKEKVNVFRLVANVRKKVLVIYRYKNIQVQVSLRRRTNIAFLQMEVNILFLNK